MASAEPTDGACAARIRKGPFAGAYCTKPPMTGQARCGSHGGRAPQAKAAAARRIAEAQAAAAVVTYGLPVEIHPLDALRSELWRTQGAVLWLEQQVRALAPEELIWGTKEIVDKRATEFKGIDRTEAALIHGWMEHYRWERKHLAEVSALCVKVGIDLLEQQRIQQQAEEFLPVLRRVVSALGADPDDAKVTALILAALQPGDGGPLAVTA